MSGSGGKAAVKTLDEAGPYFLSLVEAGQDCVRVLSPDGVLHHMNAHGRELLELGHDNPHLGVYWPSLWPASGRAVAANAVEKGRAGQASYFRAFCPTAKGMGKWWDTAVVPIQGADGAIDWLLATSRDVTEEIETRSFLATLVDLLPVSVMVKSAFDGRYVLVNRAAEEMLGVKADEIVGRSAAELFPPAIAAAFAAEDREVVESGRIKVTVDEAVVMPNGDVRYFDTKKIATRGDDGVHHVIAVGEDITERHETTIALNKARMDAEQASRAKLSFLSQMSHEIRTPLNGVIGLTDSLARAPLPKRERQLAEMVNTSAHNLQRLLVDVLDFARLDAGDVAIEPERFDVGAAIRATAAPWRRLAKAKGLALTVRVQTNLVVVADRARFSQILSNILSNAVKFTNAGKIVVTAERDGERVRIAVADTGVGFAMDKAETIFQRFEQADESTTRRFGGVGLGLAFARELATRMDGAMGCRSRPGEGATFWVDLPGGEALAGKSEQAAEEPQRTLRCLIADDHPTNRMVIEAMLGSIAEIESVEDGEQAVQAFEARRFDVVLMDLQMPVMDGLTAIREIRSFEARAQRPATPIIVVSASALAEHVAVARSAGADMHLAKPLQLATLLDALQTCLDGGLAERLSE